MSAKKIQLALKPIWYENEVLCANRKPLPPHTTFKSLKRSLDDQSDLERVEKRLCKAEKKFSARGQRYKSSLVSGPLFNYTEIKSTDEPATSHSANREGENHMKYLRCHAVESEYIKNQRNSVQDLKEKRAPNGSFTYGTIYCNYGPQHHGRKRNTMVAPVSFSKSPY